MFSDKFRVAILKVLGSYMFFKQNFKSVVILGFEIMIFFKHEASLWKVSGLHFVRFLRTDNGGFLQRSL